MQKPVDVVVRRMDGDIHQRLKVRAARERTTIKALLVKALQEYLATPIRTDRAAQ